MIYITGDTHGLIDFDKLPIFLDSHNVSKDDYLIILGDAGIFWQKDDDILSYYDKLKPTILFIDGNHENFDLLNNHEIVEIFGAKAHIITDHIYHILRGEILTLNNKTFLCVGGGTSMDKRYRKPGISWWEDENIKDEDIENAINNLSKVNYKVDYVLTHTSPSAVHKNIFHYWDDNNVFQLDKINTIVDTKHWYFGHYHIDLVIDDKFKCFYKNIEEIL